MFYRLILLCSAVTYTGVVSASLVEISWPDDGTYHHTESLAAGDFAELCSKLETGQSVAWSFEAGAELDFNIHFHQGNEVMYPVKASAVQSLADTLAVSLNQTYCWMWSNTGDSPVQLGVDLRLNKG